MIHTLQGLLQRLYGIDGCPDVRDFLVTDEASVRSWEGAGARASPEKLLIHQDGDALDIALYLDSALLERLEELDPLQRLSRRNLADFCTALEGVSHFNYVAWSAAANRCVTLLELEMQAEVDKYVGARFLLERQPDRELAADLFRILFDDPRFHDTLSTEELERYAQASRYAGKYCRSLESRFGTGLLDVTVLRELRAFYRLSQPAKVSHIHSAAYA
jgi:hypothetical protein